MSAAEPQPDRARWLIALGALLYAAGVALLALAVYVDLPGPLAAFGEPTAWWPVAATLAAGVLGFGTWRYVNRRNSRPFAVVLLALGIATVLVLASASYARCPDQGLSTFWSVVTRVIGLVTNNYVTEMFTKPGCTAGGVPLALQFARLAQLIVLLVAATSAVTALLRTQVDRVAVRLSPRLSVALGADLGSVPLLTALASGGERRTLAAFTSDPAAPWVAQARAAGWRVVVTDPRRLESISRLLQRPGHRHALQRLAVLAPDSTEAQRLVALVQAAVGDRKPVTGRDGVRVLLRIDEAWQAEDWRRRFLDRIPRWIVDTISENEVTARLLVDDLLTRGADTVLVTGPSDLTFALLAELAQRERERALEQEPEELPRVTVVGKGADQVLEEHALAQRRFGNARLDRVAAEPGADLDEVVARTVADGAVAALVFTGDVSVGEQRTAARLGATHPDLLVYSRHDDVAGLGAEPLLAQVRAYGATLDAGQGRPVDGWERIGRLVHEHYVRLYPDPGNPAREPWDRLDPFYRETNVRQVLTALGSAVEAGRSWGASAEVAEAPTPEQLETMARAEHESWVEQRLRHGWRYAERRDDAARRHPSLKPWDELDEDSRDKTRRGVEGTLDLLATLGYRSFDDPYRVWHRFRRRGEVTAVRRDEGWSWTTADGTVLRGRAGDWEVTDDDGASRSVAAEVFDRTHEALGRDRFRRIGQIRGRLARPGEVVHTLEGDTTARPGQWLLHGVADEEWLVSEAHLRASYDDLGRTEAPRDDVRGTAST